MQDMGPAWENFIFEDLKVLRYVLIKFFPKIYLGYKFLSIVITWRILGINLAES